jgi:hypothetical protein
MKLLKLHNSRLHFTKPRGDDSSYSYHPGLSSRSQILSKKARLNRGTQKGLLDFLTYEKTVINSKIEALKLKQDEVEGTPRRRTGVFGRPRTGKPVTSTQQDFAISTEATIFSSPKRRPRLIVTHDPSQPPEVPAYLAPTASSVSKLGPPERQMTLNSTLRGSPLNTSNSSQKSGKGNRTNRSMNKSINRSLMSKRSRFLKKQQDMDEVKEEPDDVIVVDVRLSSTKTVALVIDKKESCKQAVSAFAAKHSKSYVELTAEAAAKLEEALTIHRR